MKSPNYLTGIGQDSHKFDEETNNKPLMLGGYKVENHIGLKGNSDADVILHSIFNAISSALGKRSLGVYADSLCKEKNITDSKKYLEIAFKMLAMSNYYISNISLSIECKTPNIEKISTDIKKSLQSILNVPIENIGLTATSGEELTAFGQGLGIQCITIVRLSKKPTPIYKKPVFIITVLILISYLFALYNLMDIIENF